MHKYSAVLTRGKILFDRITARAEVQTGLEPCSKVARNGHRECQLGFKILPETFEINRKGCKHPFTGASWWKWFQQRRPCGFYVGLMLHLREYLVNKITAEVVPSPDFGAHFVQMSNTDNSLDLL